MSVLDLPRMLEIPRQWSAEVAGNSALPVKSEVELIQVSVKEMDLRNNGHLLVILRYFFRLLSLHSLHNAISLFTLNSLSSSCYKTLYPHS